MSTIQSLVQEYNATEATQSARLQQICELLAARQGPRRLVVADHAVTDFRPPSIEALVTKLNRGISAVSEGNENV